MRIQQVVHRTMKVSSGIVTVFECFWTCYLVILHTKTIGLVWPVLWQRICDMTHAHTTIGSRAPTSGIRVYNGARCHHTNACQRNCAWRWPDVDTGRIPFCGGCAPWLQNFATWGHSCSTTFLNENCSKESRLKFKKLWRAFQWARGMRTTQKVASCIETTRRSLRSRSWQIFLCYPRKIKSKKANRFRASASLASVSSAVWPTSS